MKAYGCLILSGALGCRLKLFRQISWLFIKTINVVNLSVDYYVLTVMPLNCYNWCLTSLAHRIKHHYYWCTAGPMGEIFFWTQVHVSTSSTPYNAKQTSCHFNIIMPTYHYKNIHPKGETVMRPFCLYDGNLYTWTTGLYSKRHPQFGCGPKTNTSVNIRH